MSSYESPVCIVQVRGGYLTVNYVFRNCGPLPSSIVSNAMISSTNSSSVFRTLTSKNHTKYDDDAVDENEGDEATKYTRRTA